MSLVKWTFIGLLALPAAEIALFLMVAALVGWFWVCILFVATSAIGIFLLRRSGRSDLGRVADGLAKEGWRGVNRNTQGLANVLGAFLLVLPGFITDLAGAALFIPAVRRWGARVMAGMAQKPKLREDVIDLEPGEWRRIPEKKPRRPRSRRRA
jgi:UPF0716 protein FxsA